MATRAELTQKINEQQEHLRDLRTEVDRLRKELECRHKDVAAARAETALANENLARAMGYIDRINDQERPATGKREPLPVYDEPTPARGPLLRQAPQPDGYGYSRSR